MIEQGMNSSSMSQSEYTSNAWHCNYMDTYAYTNTVIQVLKAGVSQKCRYM